MDSLDTGRKGLSRAEPLFFFAGAPAPPAASKAPLVPSPVLQSPSEALGMGAGPAGPLPPLAGGEAFPFPSPEQGLALSGAGFPGMLGTLPLPLSLGQPPPSPLLSHSLFGVLAGGGGQPPPEPLLPPPGGPGPPLAPGEPEGPSLLVASLLPPPPSDLLPPPSAPPSNLLASFLPLLALGPTAGDGEGSAEGAGGPSGETFSGLGDLPPLLFPPLSAPPTLIALNSALPAASLDPPSGTPPQVRIGVSGWDRTRDRIRDGSWESKAFSFMSELFLRAFEEGLVLSWG